MNHRLVCIKEIIGAQLTRKILIDEVDHTIVN